ncbi:MAG: ATP-binding cassette domain-containing protein, partial [Nitrospinota bacterium]|nr:ATP-binding cassette domain-containing protein [Nitrospinota bacterium]
MAMDPKRNGDTLVEMIGLQKFFPIREGLFRLRSTYVRAVEDVNLTIREGETLGLVGESGCGKTTLGRVVVRLIEPTGGKILFRGESLLDLNGVDLRRRRRDLQMVFQDPAASLNPRKTILQSVGEPLRIHGLAKG